MNAQSPDRHRFAVSRRVRSRFLRSCLAIIAGAVLLFVSSPASAQVPRVLPEGELPKDVRLEPLKDLDGYFPFAVPETREAWEARSAQVRRQLLVALGLWPMPTRTPLNAVIHGKVGRDDYTVEKVYFESFPGFYVTGNLYRPKKGMDKKPGVLCPHGHWSNGRFTDAGVDAVRRDIVNGAERFEEGGRSPLQARCVQLARMGCVVFHYDMIGYADSQQISFDIAHRFAKQRPEMNAAENWGLFSPQAESHLQSIMGMQAYGSIRALDFLTSLPDVDPERIAVTGASGGGTQTFVLCAIDPRPAVAIPAVMVSTAMQGGCTCENCSLLRVGTGNVEIAALFAPKPQLVTAADDWTKEMETKGFPELQRLYGLMGAEDKVALKALTHFGHNYNYVSRAAMYSWVDRQFELGLPEPIVEEDYHRLSRDEMSVWNADHPRPEGGDEFERKLLRWWTDDARKQIEAVVPGEGRPLEAYRELVGAGHEAIIGRTLPSASDIVQDGEDGADGDGYKEYVVEFANERHGEWLPAVVLVPLESEKQHAVIWLTGKGKAGLYGDDGKPRPAVRRLLDAGVGVMGADLFMQGEFLADGKPITQTRRVGNPREAAGYTFGYNHSLFAQRVHDVLTIVASLRDEEEKPLRIDLVGVEGAGPLVAAACPLAREVLHGAAIDTGGFRFGKVSDLHDVNFLPGGAKYGDVPGMLSLAAPMKLWIAGEGKELPKIVESTYRAAGAPDAVTTFDGKSEEAADAAVTWLLRQ